MIEIVKGDHEANMPESLAALLIKNRGWEVADGQKASEELAELIEQEVEAPVVGRFTQAEPEEESDGVAERNTAEVEERDEEVPAAEETAEEEVAAAEAQAPVSDVELNNEAACDDDLPDGIVFADSAYTTVVDEKTGEKIRVLKTHCRNGHEYSGANVKIRVRDDKAYRECQTCLAGRKKRAAAKRAAEKG